MTNTTNNNGTETDEANMKSMNDILTQLKNTQKEYAEYKAKHPEQPISQTMIDDLKKRSKYLTTTIQPILIGSMTLLINSKLNL